MSRLSDFERQLDRQAADATDDFENFLLDIDNFINPSAQDQEDFMNIVQKKQVSTWAVSQQVKSSFETKKKLIDSF